MQKRERDKRFIIQRAPIGASGIQSYKETMKWYKTLDSKSPLYPFLTFHRGVRELEYIYTNVDPLRPVLVGD